MPPTLLTTRLCLRAFTSDDAPRVRALAGDARVAAMTEAIPHPYPEGAAETWIATHGMLFDARLALNFAITPRDGGDLLGTVTLMNLNAEEARAELGYWVGVPYWGQGYCPEAAARLVAYAYEAFGITRIVARCLARNPASARVMEKIGMLAEGRLRLHAMRGGQAEDVLLYGLNLPGRGAPAAG